jgi:hypothetical protein
MLDLEPLKVFEWKRRNSLVVGKKEKYEQFQVLAGS